MYYSAYDKSTIRNKEYSIESLVGEYYKNDFVCLDLGCGNCRKTANLALRVKEYYAIDIDPNRTKAAKLFCKDINNIKFGVCDNFYLPFNAGYFDLVSCFMSKCNFFEVSRVLRQGGYFIFETLGANDKREVKSAFGYDDIGLRGRLLNRDPREYLKSLELQLSLYFKIIKKFTVEQKTTIRTLDLAELFTMTQEVRDFNKKNDIEVLRGLEREGTITFNEEKLIIVCKKQ